MLVAQGLAVLWVEPGPAIRNRDDMVHTLGRDALEAILLAKSAEWVLPAVILAETLPFGAITAF
jgi:hypothetical protein